MEQQLHQVQRKMRQQIKKTQSPSTSTTTVVQQNNNNNVNSESKGNSSTQDTSWTDSLNGWIQKSSSRISKYL